MKSSTVTTTPRLSNNANSYRQSDEMESLPIEKSINLYLRCRFCNEFYVYDDLLQHFREHSWAQIMGMTFKEFISSGDDNLRDKRVEMMKVNSDIDKIFLTNEAFSNLTSKYYPVKNQLKIKSRCWVVNNMICTTASGRRVDWTPESRHKVSLTSKQFSDSEYVVHGLFESWHGLQASTIFCKDLINLASQSSQPVDEAFLTAHHNLEKVCSKGNFEKSHNVWSGCTYLVSGSCRTDDGNPLIFVSHIGNMRILVMTDKKLKFLNCSHSFFTNRDEQRRLVPNKKLTLPVSRMGAMSGIKNGEIINCPSTLSPRKILEEEDGQVECSITATNEFWNSMLNVNIRKVIKELYAEFAFMNDVPCGEDDVFVDLRRFIECDRNKKNLGKFVSQKLIDIASKVGGKLQITVVVVIYQIR